MLTSLILTLALVGQKAVITDRSGNPLPAEVPAGEVVYFSAKLSERGEKNIPLWMIEPPERRERAEKFEGGTILVVPTGTTETTLRVTLIVAKGDNAAVAPVTVRIRGPKPPTPIPPGPVPPDPTPPGPVPPVPPTPVPDFMGFAAMAKAEGNKLPPQNRTQAVLVADNFDAVASRLAAGSIASPDAANKELKDRNIATLGNDRLLWLPWFRAWQAIADKSNSNGTLTTNEHYVKAYRATANGLRGVN